MQNFNKIVVPLILMLKITGLFKVLVLKVFRADINKIVRVKSGKANKMFKN